MAEDRQSAVVLSDRYRWQEGDPPNTVIYEADKGQTIEVSAAEFKRGEGLNALASVSASSGESLPSTHKELDALAAERGVTFGADVKTVADKQAALSASYTDVGGPSFQGAPGAASDEELAALSDEELVEHAKGAGIDTDGQSRAALTAAIQAAGAITTAPSTPSP